jgi:hypothetical protein
LTRARPSTSTEVDSQERSVKRLLTGLGFLALGLLWLVPLAAVTGNFPRTVRQWLFLLAIVPMTWLADVVWNRLVMTNALARHVEARTAGRPFSPLRIAYLVAATLVAAAVLLGTVAVLWLGAHLVAPGSVVSPWSGAITRP